MNILQITLVGLLMGTMTALYAQKKGKDPYIWFASGFFFGLMGFIFLFIKVNYGLRKQKKEVPNSELLLKKQLKTSMSDNLWYYLDLHNTQVGPMSFDALNKAWERGNVGDKTYVWCDGLVEWITLESLLTE